MVREKVQLSVLVTLCCPECGEVVHSCGVCGEHFSHLDVVVCEEDGEKKVHYHERCEKKREKYLNK